MVFRHFLAAAALCVSTLSQAHTHPTSQILTLNPFTESKGDVYYLNGNLDNQMTQVEWAKYYEVAKDLVQAHYRVVMNPSATVDDVREAVQNPKVKAIIWSSQASEDGEIYDANDEALPATLFFENASPTLKQVVLSSSYGDVTSKIYTFPKSVKVKFWEDLTFTSELFQYLHSDEWLLSL